MTDIDPTLGTEISPFGPDLPLAARLTVERQWVQGKITSIDVTTTAYGEVTYYTLTNVKGRFTNRAQVDDEGQGCTWWALGTMAKNEIGRLVGGDLRVGETIAVKNTGRFISQSGNEVNGLALVSTGRPHLGRPDLYDAAGRPLPREKSK